MKRSMQRILTTHTGSLPRPPDLLQLILDREDGRPVDPAQFAERIRSATAEVVARQVEVGVDVMNDGEVSKVGYSTYVKDRLSGFGGQGQFPPTVDLFDFPAYAARFLPTLAAAHLQTPACDAPITPRDSNAAQTDIANFKAALHGHAYEDAFMTAASPGVVALFLQNRYYPDHESYVHAIAQAMRPEYEAITQAGFLLQLDCPDLAVGRHSQFAALSLEDFRRQARINVEALNQAVINIPSDQLRMHLCWGNYEGPHHKDVALRDILDLALAAKPEALSFEACNPRHAHEWKVFKERKLPEGKVIIPGVLDSTTNFVEHPELVAERIVRFAEIVGRENVIAGTDCGFRTFAGHGPVDADIVWAKLQAMTEGAKLASQELWKRQPASSRSV